jgi:hypothetical protein
MVEFFGQLTPCLMAMEACAHWGRQLVALGHEVKLIPRADRYVFSISIFASEPTRTRVLCTK